VVGDGRWLLGKEATKEDDYYGKWLLRKVIANEGVPKEGR